MSVRIKGARVESLTVYKTIIETFDNIERHIDGLPGDPGSLYDIDERVRRVIGVLQARAKE